ncbi:MAG: preprotein translocase subunit YajC [Bacillota bacterium]|mgnify:CR=1 FL=1|nr:preprotein translocase subunit YajC [Bacillota bacterium]
MSPETMSYLVQFGPLAAMMLLLYFLFIRPQKKEQERRQAMLSALQKGDRVITLGGMYGTIADISEKSIVLKVADKIEIKFAKSAVQGLQNGDH